jgi:hypothetical protein
VLPPLHVTFLQVALFYEDHRYTQIPAVNIRRYIASRIYIPLHSAEASYFVYVGWLFYYTAISIKVVHEQSGKVEYECERLLGIALKIH